jgi:hypothetical protein
MRPRIGDGLWVRLVDVGEALSARRYAADGASCSTSSTSSAPGTRALARLERGREADDLRAAAPPRREHARLDLPGRFTFSELVRGGRIEELRRGAAARADAMFAAERAPWCPEIF